MRTIPITCRQCGKDFEVEWTRRNRNPSYCSIECRNIGTPYSLRKGAYVPCAICGVSFYVKRKRFIENTTGQFFCCWGCYQVSHAAKVLSLPCKQCGKIYERPFVAHRMKPRNKFCSETCKGAYYSGSRAFRWRGGVSYYRGEDWLKQRKLARKRDKNTCQQCGKRHGLRDVHHIIPWRVSHDNSLSNLVVLCRICHVAADTKYWRDHPVVQLKLI